MLAMRSLLVADPRLPRETREAIARGDDSAHERLVALGVNDCEAKVLLGAVGGDDADCGAFLTT